jgi:hypothetical protein
MRIRTLIGRRADQVMGLPDDHALSPARRARCGGGLGPARSPRISSNISDTNDLVEFTLLKPMSAGVDRLDDERRMLSGRLAAPQALLLLC